MLRAGLFLLLLVVAPVAHAEDDDKTERGRQAYLRGVQLAKAEQWGAALGAFEEAAVSRDAPVIQFNIAYCLRALGRYVAAREALGRVMKDSTGLDPSQREDAKAYLSEFEKLLVRVKVTLEPEVAALAVDGRPLKRGEADDQLLAGVAPPGDGASPGRSAFTVILDPGLHVFRAARPGHQDAVIQRSYKPGEQTALALKLDVLPATVAIRSEPASAIVRIDKREVGLAPIEVQRTAGRYRLEVVRDGFDTYAATLDLSAGQRADITAKLVPYKEPLTQKWWFWTGAAAVIVGGVALTYFLTRPEPQPPDYDPGNANWLVVPR
jgi:hypothetical protein